MWGQKAWLHDGDEQTKSDQALMSDGWEFDSSGLNLSVPYNFQFTSIVYSRSVLGISVAF